jgi:hypothetical protein
MSIISNEEAKKMTDLHRETNADAAHSHTFDADKIRELLKDPNTKGLRIDYGINEGKSQLIAVGVDGSGNTATAALTALYPCPGDSRCPCPPYCQ